MVVADETAAQPHATHTYTVTCSWSGSTGVGYERYSRSHVGQAPPTGAALRMSADPAFRGDPALLNPEQLLVLSAASCQLLSFLAVAARARLDVRDYQDTGDAVMTENGRGGGRISEITLRPRITVVTDATEERLRRLVRLAHEQCYIAGSLNCPITVEPTFEILAPYAFRDTEAAARRLAVVSEVFDPGSRAFVAAHRPADVRLAADLGCGPGHTTRMLAGATGAARTVGLDVSAAFLAAAAAAGDTAATAAGDEEPGLDRVGTRSSGRSGDGVGGTDGVGGVGGAVEGAVEFVRHDVRRVPFPAAARGADVLYARLLLAHLADVTTAIGGWLTQLAPDGVLLLDEIESIDTDQPILSTYLDHARHLLAARGTTLHAGRLLNTALHDLAAHRAMPTFEVEYNATERLSPPVPTAAAMFGMNLAVWRSDPRFHDRQAELDRLAAGLTDLAAAPGEGHITWAMRRVAIRRLGDREAPPAAAPSTG
ncbi:OsmC family protein [Frankia nepalensis]|nr:OsmC family protein [Frankia nepalensis]